MDPVEISHIAQGDVPSRRAPVVHPFVHKSGGFPSPQRSLSSSRMEVIPERSSDTPNQEHHEPISLKVPLYPTRKSRTKDRPSLVLARPSHCNILYERFTRHANGPELVTVRDTRIERQGRGATRIR